LESGLFHRGALFRFCRKATPCLRLAAGNGDQPKPDEPEPKGKANPSAVRANLDDPPIHIRPIFPPSAGAKQKNHSGSGRYGGWKLPSRPFNRNGFFAESVTSQAIRD
jgi:hypothetical protein